MIAYEIAAEYKCANQTNADAYKSFYEAEIENHNPVASPPAPAGHKSVTISDDGDNKKCVSLSYASTREDGRNLAIALSNNETLKANRIFSSLSISEVTL